MIDSTPPDSRPAADGAGAPTLPRGTRLPDGLEIERVLAADGFAIVYLANDPALQRQVAVKEYFPRALAMRDAEGAVVLRAPVHAEAFEHGRAAFMDESRQLARVDHPSLVRVLRLREDRGTAWRVMPYYPGRTLAELRAAMTEPPDEPALRALADGLLGALEALHREGLLHGALAPDHVVLLPDDRPVLLDFGAVARALVGDRGQGLMQSLEPSFAPLERQSPMPERPCGPWSDLYSLAALLRWCILGEPPAAATRAGTTLPMAEAVLRWPQRHYGVELLGAIDAALAPRPADRPQSVAEFRALLDGRLDRAGLGERARARRAASSAAAVADAAPRAPASGFDGRTEPTFVEDPSDEHVLAALDRALAAVGIGASAASAAARPAPPPRAPAAEPRRAPAPSAARRPAEAPPAVPGPAEEPMRAPPRAPVGAVARGPRRLVWSSALALLAALVAIGWQLGRQWTPEELHDAATAAGAQMQRSAGAALAGLRERGGALLAAVQEQLGRTDHSTSIDLPTAPTAAGVAAATPPASSPSLEAAAASLRAAEAALAAARPAAPAARPADAAPAPPAAVAEPPPAVVEPPRSVAEPPPAVAEQPPAVAERPPAVSATEAPAPKPNAVAAAQPAARPKARPRERAAHTVARASARPSTPPRRPAVPEEVSPRPAPPPAVAAVPAPAAVLAKGPASPREACGDRTQFALYYCMQTQCEQPQWAQHPQCRRLRDRDEVD